MDSGNDVLLVIPAYEEHCRLPSFLRDLVKQLEGVPFTTTVQIVDDGSSPESRRELAQALDEIKTGPSVHILPPLHLKDRCGKGCAIRTGWNMEAEARWLAFVDADGAIPAREVSRVLGLIVGQSNQTEDEVYAAVRVPGRDRQVDRTWLRKWSSRLFTLIVNTVFPYAFCDPQCGFKIIPSSAWRDVCARSRENGFCFDLELLVLLKRNRNPIVKLPIDWREKSGGHFQLLPDGVGTLFSAGCLWLRINIFGR